MSYPICRMRLAHLWWLKLSQGTHCQSLVHAPTFSGEMATGRMESGSRKPLRPSLALTYGAHWLLSLELGLKGAHEKGRSCRMSMWSSGHSAQRSPTCAGNREAYV